MTIYATKIAKLIVEPISHQCAHCGTVHTMDMHVFQKYKTVLGVPFFPTNKTGVVLCTHCRRSLRRREMSADLLKTYDKVKMRATMPIWTWAGAALVTLTVICSIVFNVLASLTQIYLNKKLIV